MKCESCNIREVDIEEPTDGVFNSYRLCIECHYLLDNYALRPLEYFNLTTIHGHSFFLNDDLYDDETGEATQPKIDVLDQDKFPFPKLEDIKLDLKKLVNYACVQYVTSSEVMDLLKLHDHKQLLNYLDEKVKYNRAVNYKLYDIAAKVLGPIAEDWIREEWKLRRENEFLIYTEAICNCLPFDEAFYLLTNEIETSEDRNFTNYSFGLIYLQNSKTLDWIESITTRIKNVSNDWGSIAALSQFDWDRADKWLTMGRPLSLIALDAIYLLSSSGQNQNRSLLVKEKSPQFSKDISQEIIAKRVNEYLDNDNVPRTRDMVNAIISNLFESE